MKGKERDLKLANELRERFIKRYENNLKDLKEVMNHLGDNCLEKLIYRFKGEYQINLYRDYYALKKIAAEVRENKIAEVFEAVCEEDEARAWINDNGKYTALAFEALYKVFKRDEKLMDFINVTDKKRDRSESEELKTQENLIKEKAQRKIKEKAQETEEKKQEKVKTEVKAENK